MSGYYLLTFESSQGAIAAHKALRADTCALLMPVIREISASCGISVRFAPEMLGRAKNILAGLQDFECYFVPEAGPDKHIKPLKINIKQSGG